MLLLLLLFPLPRLHLTSGLAQVSDMINHICIYNRCRRTPVYLHINMIAMARRNGASERNAQLTQNYIKFILSIRSVYVQEFIVDQMKRTSLLDSWYSYMYILYSFLFTFNWLPNNLSPWAEFIQPQWQNMWAHH